ncbi:AEC family transporter [Clostridium sp. YIM B02515]|uniref:AEC family transporter n=1 Tax=Clostridium rhizosphaerae TaxID=2803861 RepID=A0ABS1T903_9CLOT|nr:AEC family transporter [Clostridium rhizosphaerae]MBL4935823.1 AEC family transporter [Clostridium rhizosphaerae]
MLLIDAAQSILSIILMISLGYILTKNKWFDDSTSKLFSKIVINLSLPALMVSNLMTTFTKESLSHSGVGIIIPFISIIVCYLISVFISKIINIAPDRRGTFQCMFFLSNTIFIGLPVNIALFGEASVPNVLYYYFSNTTIFWTLGIYLIKKDGGLKDSKLFTINNLKNVFTPPLIGFITGITLILLDIRLPKFIMDTCKYLGNLTTPMSMLFIGIVISSINLKDFKFDKYTIGVITGRFIISPIVTYCFSLILCAPVLMKNVFFIQSALPVMATASIVTKEYGADYEYASVMIAVTTIASLIFIPFYRFLLG